jgi:hypothetical protein
VGRIDDILLRARDTLADESGIRWSNARLLRILDEGQKELVLTAKLLRKKETLLTLTLQEDHETPDDCYRLMRITFQNKVLPIISHEEMDDLDNKGLLAKNTDNWETATSDISEKIVYDKLNTGRFRIYPMLLPIEGAGSLTPLDPAVSEDFGTVVGSAEFTMSSDFGGVVDVTYTNPSESSGVYQLNSNVDDNYGVTILMDAVAEDFIMYYLKRPDTLTSITDNLEVNQVWDTCLKHYVIGMALRDDRDTQNRTIGNEALTLYAAGVREAVRSSSQDFTASRTHYNTPYNDGF